MNASRRYKFDKPKNDEAKDLRLTDALKVSKLKEKEMKMYFNSLRMDKKSPERKTEPNGDFFDDRIFKKFLKRYGLKKKVEEKPVMKRMPLTTVKTIQMELPLDCVTAIPPKRKMSSSFIEIAKPITRNKKPNENDLKPKSPICLEMESLQEDEGFQFDNNAISSDFIEKQLEATRNEITLASTQLEQIRALLAQRKEQLSPIVEETPQLPTEDDKNKKKKTKKEESNKKPKAEWKLKSSSTFRKNSRKKLMLTLDNLNQRLQKIQEKYFTEPKMKFRSIDQILAQPTSKQIETIYQNNDFDKVNIKMKSNMTKTDVNESRNLKIPKPPKEKDPIQILLSPKFETFEDSDINLPIAIDDITSRIPQKGILRRRNLSDSSVEVSVGAPTLQNSIFKSNFLMKEFDVRPSEDFDFADLKLKREDFGCSEFIKKNVRFAKSKSILANAPTKSDKELQQAIDFALQNSVFYPEM